MKKYRVFVLDLGELPNDYGSCSELVLFGIGNADGHYAGSSMRIPKAAVWRIRKRVVFTKAFPSSKFERKLIESKSGKFVFRIPNNIAAYRKLFDQIPPLCDDAVFVIICRFADCSDTVALIYGTDIVPVNLGTSDGFELLQNTLDCLCGKNKVSSCPNVTASIIYSDNYLNSKNERNM